MMGIEWNLFWHELNPRKLKPFRKAREDSLKLRRIQTNLTTWMQGFYIQRAIGSCFSKTKYPEKPLEEFDFKDEREEQPLTIEQEAAMFAQYAMQCRMARKARDEARGSK